MVFTQHILICSSSSCFSQPRTRHNPKSFVLSWQEIIRDNKFISNQGLLTLNSATKVLLVYIFLMLARFPGLIAAYLNKRWNGLSSFFYVPLIYPCPKSIKIPTADSGLPIRVSNNGSILAPWKLNSKSQFKRVSNHPFAYDIYSTNMS